MIQWKQVLAGLAVGLVVGGGTVRLMGRRLHRSMNGEKRYERILGKFDRELSLTPDQKEKVRAILQAKRKKVDAQQSEGRAKFDALRRSARGEIRKELTKAQQDKFDALTAKWEERRRKREPLPSAR